MKFSIRQATIADLDALVPLLDAYRVFYRQLSDVAVAREFLLERFQHLESVIFIAISGDGAALGFTQLFPSFSTAAARRIFILNDLYVIPEARGAGVGAALLAAAVDFGRSLGCFRLMLSTEVTNLVAQGVYEGNGWTRRAEFYTYVYALE